MSAVLFGSIGTLADTSELQREAFNEAFTTHGLNWNWSREEYQDLLSESGGANRIAAYAQARGDTVDAGAVHASKSENFQRRLRSGGVTPRPGVKETIDQASRDGIKVALVTTTTPENVAALTDALAPAVDIGEFALVVDTSDVSEPKPAPDAYRFALDRLGEQPGDCVAIEDNLGGAKAAAAAGLTCVAFPGENNAGHEFDSVADNVDALDPAELRSLIGR